MVFRSVCLSTKRKGVSESGRCISKKKGGPHGRIFAIDNLFAPPVPSRSQDPEEQYRQ